MTVRSLSLYIYLPLQLLAKKAVKVSKISHNFKIKHFKENFHVKIVDNYICTHNTFIESKICSVLPVLY